MVKAHSGETSGDERNEAAWDSNSDIPHHVLLPFDLRCECSLCLGTRASPSRCLFVTLSRRTPSFLSFRECISMVSRPFVELQLKFPLLPLIDLLLLLGLHLPLLA